MKKDFLSKSKYGQQKLELNKIYKNKKGGGGTDSTIEGSKWDLAGAREREEEIL